jgi:hypothetical protein
MIRDRLALLFLRWAARLTRWGDTYDHAMVAIEHRERFIRYAGEP